MNYTGYLLPFIPLFIATTLLTTPPAEQLIAYAFFCVTFLIWWMFLSYVFKLKNQTDLFSEEKTIQYGNSLKMIIPLIILLLISIAFLRRTISEFQLILTVGALFFQGIAIRITMNKAVWLKFLSLLATLSILAYCSYNILLGNYSWQIVTLSITGATVPLVSWLGHSLKTLQNKNTSKTQKSYQIIFLSRSYSIFLALFPATILTFSQLYYLPRLYSFVALSFFVCPKLIQETRIIETGDSPSESFIRQSSYYPFLILSLLVLVRILS